MALTETTATFAQSMRESDCIAASTRLKKNSDNQPVGKMSACGGMLILTTPGDGEK
jgi:hypothetical protein